MPLLLLRIWILQVIQAQDAVDLDSQTFTISGTANEIETSASGQTITIGLPSTITANVTGNVSQEI
jgi:hypothetical protein